jgi:multidrug efflux pump subunit AcrB
MWIVRLALRRPYTFVVMALLILIGGVFTAFRMTTDIFPVINIPVVTVIWQYAGISAQEMERRIVTVSERAFTTTVGDIEHIESQSMNGISVIKVFFQPGANVAQAVAQVTAVSGAVTRILPPGITPPFILRYNVADVPVLTLSVGGLGFSEAELNDYSNSFIRTQLSTVRGASVPQAYGGKTRQIMIDIDPVTLAAKGLSPVDLSNAITAQNLILPSGFAKFGDRDYTVRLNSSPDAISALNNLPIKQVNGTTVYIKDVAQVHDGFAVQQNLVRLNGRRATYLTILKSGAASTLDVVARVRAALPRVAATLPKAITLTTLADQSVFVRAALNGVVREAVIAAALTGLMILLFLGSWRSTLIITISIPLSILCSVLALAALGQTINVMTLGGLALAVGILVDDATVELENVHRHLAMGEPIVPAILNGAQEIATPAFVSTLSICIVFVPVFFLTGAARSLFAPLAMAVIFAMLASYLLSRTLVPTMVRYLLADEGHGHDGEATPEGASVFVRINRSFERAFERMRVRYHGLLERLLHHRVATLLTFVAVVATAGFLLPVLGQDFFPKADGGQLRLHVRAPPGTRIEATEHIFTEVEHEIRRIIPAKEIALQLDNIGIPNGINLSFGDNVSIGPADGEIMVSLDEHRSHSTREYERLLRAGLRERFPNLVFFFQPADITSQILNFGLPSPIDVQIVGQNRQGNYALAQHLARRIASIPGAVDVHVGQVMNAPELLFSVDRTKAQQVGLSQRDVANNLLVSLASSGQVQPNYWLNPLNGVQYLVAVQTPQYRVASMTDVYNTPVVAPGQEAPQMFGNLASVSRTSTMAVVNHYNVAPVFDVFVNTQGRDLGGVAGDIERIVQSVQDSLPRGSTTVIRGQVSSMRESFLGLGVGLLGAILLVYFLMVVNFQSWTDPAIVILGLPGALTGIAWMLFVTRTTLSVPSLMGSIMAMGVATANSILLVTFANEKRAEGLDAIAAALESGSTRLRPVIMTALAMIIGMLPMALGLGEGGEQNAPLGRAVIGGLLVATATTLLVVPIIYSLMRAKAPAPSPEVEVLDAHI